jgi:hypothetical protein
MLLTVVVTVATHDLAKGVLSGVLLSALFFARKVGRMLDVQREDTGDTQVYRVRGQVFFASAGQQLRRSTISMSAEGADRSARCPPLGPDRRGRAGTRAGKTGRAWRRGDGGGLMRPARR